MEARAILRNIPMSPRKMRLVVDNIRGKRIGDALAIAKFSNKEAGLWLEKLLLSAISNWQNKSGEGAEDFDLFVKIIHCDPGTMLKRFQPAPQGRAHRILKRRNHVTVIVANRAPLADERTAAQKA